MKEEMKVRTKRHLEEKFKIFEVEGIEFYSQGFLQVGDIFCEHILVKNPTNVIKKFIQFFGERSSEHITYYKIDEIVFELDTEPLEN